MQIFTGYLYFLCKVYLQTFTCFAIRVLMGFFFYCFLTVLCKMLILIFSIVQNVSVALVSFYYVNIIFNIYEW